MILRTLVLAVLSRLLVPEDFGVLSAAMVLVSFVETVAQIGIGPAITQRKNLTDAHVRTGFTLSLLIAIVLVAVSWFSAPMIAAFFNMPEIEVVLLSFGSFLYAHLGWSLKHSWYASFGSMS